MKATRETQRRRRHRRIRKRIFGTKELPRLCAHRSLKNLYCQLVDDLNKQTILALSTRDKGYKEKAGNLNGGNIEAAKLLGKLLAEEATEKGTVRVVFDRGGYCYHGRIKTFAEAAREGGLQF